MVFISAITLITLLTLAALRLQHVRCNRHGVATNFL